MRATVMYGAGKDVRTVKKGDLVVVPFAWSDGTCEFCQKGLQTSCLHGGFWYRAMNDREAIKVMIEF